LAQPLPLNGVPESDSDSVLAQFTLAQDVLG
jgi:hypothetical protein